MEKQTSMAVLILVYLTGSLATYLFIRYMNRKKYGRWTKFDRTMGMLVAIAGSWTGIIAFIALSLLLPNDNELDKPSKW